MKYSVLLLILMIGFSSAGVDGIIGIDLNSPPIPFDNNTAFVNASNNWITNIGALTGVDSTQHNNVGGILTISETYLTSFGNALWCALTGCTMAGDIDMGGNDIINGGAFTSNNLTISNNIDTDFSLYHGIFGEAIFTNGLADLILDGGNTYINFLNGNNFFVGTIGNLQTSKFYGTLEVIGNSIFDNITSSGIISANGAITSAGGDIYAIAGNIETNIGDIISWDDLFVGDDADIGGDLEVSGNSNITGSVSSTGLSVTNTAGSFLMGSETTSVNYAPFEVHQNTDASYWTGLFYNDVYSPTDFIFSYYGYNDGRFSMGTEVATDLAFYTNGYSNERMVIEADGDVNFKDNDITTTANITADYFNGNWNGSSNYWKSDGSSTATGDWDIEGYGISGNYFYGFMDAIAGSPILFVTDATDFTDWTTGTHYNSLIQPGLFSLYDIVDDTTTIDWEFDLKNNAPNLKLYPETGDGIFEIGANVNMTEAVYVEEFACIGTTKYNDTGIFYGGC